MVFDTSKIIHHYKFDETSGLVATDSAGAQNLTMNIDFWRSGYINNGLSAIGQNRTAWATASSLLIPRYADFSVAAWVHINDAMITESSGNYNHGIINQWQSGNGGRLNILFAGDGHPTSGSRRKIHLSIGGVERISSGVLTAGYYHVALTRIGDVFTLYVSGVSQGTYTASTWISDVNTQIGTFGSLSSNAIQSVIDEVSFMNVGITASEVIELREYGLNNIQYPFTVNTRKGFVWDELSRTLPTSEQNAYYISNSGDDSNDGLSEARPFQTIAKLNTLTINPGWKVLFKRGDTWRLTTDDYISFQGGSVAGEVTYGAYGIGAKPLFLGSYDASSTSVWSDQGSNIWRTTFTVSNTYDIGNIIFNNESSVGIKRTSLGSVTGQGDYWHSTSDQRIYMYSVGNPGTFYTKIEMAQKVHLANIENKHYIVVRDLDFRYGGAHGISARGNYQSIINCTVKWIGGSLHETARYGNAIEWGLGSNHTYCGYCFISQVYDAGITHQAWDTGTGYYMGNGLVEFNVMEYCGYGYEIFNSLTDSGAKTENIIVKNNTITFTNEGWYMNQRHPYDMGLRVARTPTGSSGFVFKDNIVYGSGYRFVENGSTWNGSIEMDYNLYYAGSGNLFTWAGGNYSSLAAYQSATIFEDNGAHYDPLFVNASAGDYRLQSGSSALTMSSTGGFVGALDTEFPDSEAENPYDSPENSSYANVINMGELANGTFNINLTNLLPGKKYYYRGFTYDGSVYSYGEEKTFTTLSETNNTDFTIENIETDDAIIDGAIKIDFT